MKMSLIPKVKPVFLTSLFILFAVSFIAKAAVFEDAKKAFQKGKCRKAVEIGNEVVQSSRYVPEQIKEERSDALEAWRNALSECENALPPQYPAQIEKFEKEFAEITALGRGASKTDAACDLIRKLSIFLNDVKMSQTECHCTDFVLETQELLRRMMVLCPEPCKEADAQTEQSLNNLLLLSNDIKLSAELIKNKQTQNFRRKIKGYQADLSAARQNADTLMSQMDFCLGRKGNRNLGIITGTAENLSLGLGYIDQLCGMVENLQRKTQEQTKKNKLLRDSMEMFMNQINSVVDQWLQSSMPTADQAGNNMMIQKNMSQQMREMIFKLAKIDMERSLYLLDSPVEEKSLEIARLKSLKFEGQLMPEESNQLEELRQKVITKLYYSIPWPVRFWHEKRNLTILIICSAIFLVLASITAIIIKAIRSRRKKNKVEESETEKNPLL
jgi:hypothetical protein